MNHHLRSNMLIIIKKPTFNPKIRNSENNLQARYEWFMKWKDSDLDYTKNCVFIDEVGFNIIDCIISVKFLNIAYDYPLQKFVQVTRQMNRYVYNVRPKIC